MTTSRVRDFRCRLLLAAAFLVLMAGAARAASLQMVSSWGASGVPTYIAMYIYVPDRLAANPPILVVSHYCSGDAAGVFAQARTGGIVAAADMYGFIMIYPQNHLPGTTRNCWDVGTTASLTHDGGGDTQAIAQMVKYTLTRYNANPARVYAVGTSSGAMMTEALLAVYPDVFKGGAEFAGVPAGCWASSYSAGDQWSGPCAGGQVTHTPAEWGDMVRRMYPGYSGYRPRIQLWHGLSDSTISPTNQTEGIDEWTNVLGLAATPTSTTTVSLANHQWTRRLWKDRCGFDVLDAWSETAGPHGTDANLNAEYVIPFLGLDKAGDVDPVVAGCPGDGGVVAGTGGAPGTGGAGGRSGAGGAPRDGGVDGGGPGSGGIVGTGGSAGSGGVDGSGGRGQTSGTGGAPGSGGSPAGTGGAVARGTGGATATGSGGGSSSTGGSGAGGTGPDTEASGCSCTFGGGGSTGQSLAAPAAALGLALALARRRRRPVSGRLRTRHPTSSTKPG